MFKMMKIPNRERFLQVVDGSRGQVWLCLGEGARWDLKADPAARQLVRVMNPGPDGLCISLSDGRDLSAFISYLMGADPE